MARQWTWPTIRGSTQQAREKMAMESNKSSTLVLRLELISKYLTFAADSKKYMSVGRGLSSS